MTLASTSYLSDASGNEQNAQLFGNAASVAGDSVCLSMLHSLSVALVQLLLLLAPLLIVLFTLFFAAACTPNCVSCFGTPGNCSKCASGFHFDTDTCCPFGQYRSAYGVCSCECVFCVCKCVC